MLALAPLRSTATLVLAATVLLPGQVPGQRTAPESSPGWGFALGLGAGAGGGLAGENLRDEGFAWAVDLVASRQRHRLGMVFAAVAGPSGGGSYYLGATYGLAFPAGPVRVSAGVGAAYTFVDLEGAGLGVPVSLRGLFALGRSVALGAHTFAVVNDRATFGGATLALYVGRVP